MEAALAPAPTLPEQVHAADAVFEGGGVKGIAFVGALEAAEELGIREWVNVAGTSAGAIVAALLAAGHTPSALGRILESTDYVRFADFGPGGRLLGGARNALRGRGFCPGEYFTTWLEDQFADSPQGKRRLTFADLERRDLPDDLSDEEHRRARFRLRVVASDVTEGRMLVLPDDIERYEDEHGTPLRAETLEVARAVRMSMSFPFFFEPVKLYRDGRLHLIVDGGLLSNFPVFLFDGSRPHLKRWTFGFRLFRGRPPEEPTYRRVKQPLWYWPLAKAMFFSATEAWDRRLSDASADRTVNIPTGEVPTLKFDLSAAEQETLRTSGRDAARTFFATHRTYRNHAGVVAAGPAELSRAST